MYDGREALPDDHKFRGQRGRVRARYRRPQLGRGTEKIGETSQRKTNLQLASGAFSCKVAPFTPAGERTKKAPSRGGRTGSNGQQHPVVIDCEVLQKRRSRCTTPGELRATRREPLLSALKRIRNEKRACRLGTLQGEVGGANDFLLLIEHDPPRGLWTKGRSASDLSVPRSVILLACLIASRRTCNGQLLSQKDLASSTAGL